MRLADRTSPYRGLPTVLLALLFGASTAAYAQPPIAVLDALRQTIMLPGCGHWTQQERPAEVTRLLIDWLAGL